MGTPLLEVKDLQLSFVTAEGEAKVLNGISLHVEEGEAVALVGESGCGKSATVKAIMGLLPSPPTKVGAGSILYQGADLLQYNEDQLSRIRGQQISMVFQDPMTHLNPVFTIGDQLTDVVKWSGKGKVGPLRWMLGGLNGKLNRQARAKAIEWLRQVRIPDPERALNRYPVELSGGMRQRVLIALALITNPKLVIADEPGTALDVSIQDQILEVMEELVRTQKMSMLFITHNLGVARRISRRVYVMYAGEVVETGPTEQVFANPQHPYTQGLIDSIPKLSGGMGAGIDGRLPDFTRPPQGCRFASRCAHRRPACDVRPPLVEVAPGHQVACHLYKEVDQA